MDSKKSKSAEGLTRGAVEELKKLHNPPQVVKEALRATMHLLGYGEAQANDWRFIRAVLSKTGEESFLNKLSRADFNKITPDSAVKARDIMKGLPTADAIKSVSRACHSIHLWNEKAVETVFASGGKTEA